MLKLCRVTKVKVFFLLLDVNIFNFDLPVFEISAAILEKGLLCEIFSCCNKYHTPDSDSDLTYIFCLQILVLALHCMYSSTAIWLRFSWEPYFIFSQEGKVMNSAI